MHRDFLILLKFNKFLNIFLIERDVLNRKMVNIAKMSPIRMVFLIMDKVISNLYSV